MTTTALQRIGAVLGAAVIATTTAGSAARADAGQDDPAQERPCFMVRLQWNNADGPQPTCPLLRR